MGRTPNDDRSDRFNPTSSAYAAAEENEARQRGDWDDEEEGYARQAGAGAGGELRLDPVSIRICTDGVDPGHRPPTARQMCGPRVMDRQSHWLHAVYTILCMSWDHVYEAEESFRQRQGVIEALRRELEKTDEELEAVGEMPSWVQPEGRVSEYRKALGDLLDYATNPERLHGECLPTDRYGKWYHNWIPERLKFEAPVVVRGGWKELLALIIGELRGRAGEADGPAALLFEGANPLQLREQATPGVMTVRTFAGESEAMEYAARVEPTVVEYWGAPKKVRGPYAIAFPADRNEGLAAGGRDDGVRAVEWVAEALADYWDARPVLWSMVKAAAMAEWAGYAWCVYGLRVRPDGRADWDWRAARDANDAERFRDGLAQRGFRAVVIPTPAVSGPRFWTACAKPAESPWKGVRPLA